MKTTNIISLLKEWEIDYKSIVDRIIEIGDKTAIRTLKGKKYRRNYERGILIYGIINKFGIKRFLEFGTGRGFSVGCALLADPSLEIFTIDNESSDVAKKLLSELNIPLNNVQFIKSDSRVVNNRLSGMFDLVFIDGGHTYDAVKNDFNISSVRCKNGIILFDDFRKKHSGVRQFIKELKLDKLLVNTDGWIIENELISKAGDADKVENGHELNSGQIIVNV